MHNRVDSCSFSLSCRMSQYNNKRETSISMLWEKWVKERENKGSEREEEEKGHKIPKKTDGGSFGGGDVIYVGTASGRDILCGTAY